MASRKDPIAGVFIVSFLKRSLNYFEDVGERGKHPFQCAETLEPAMKWNCLSISESTLDVKMR